VGIPFLPKDGLSGLDPFFGPILLGKIYQLVSGIKY
jgi:hypothetical protein